MIMNKTKMELEDRLDRLDRGKNHVLFVGLGALFIVASWILIPSYLYGVVASRYENGEIPSGAGVVGDMFGSINALFAGFAFLLLIWSVRQGHEIVKIQREDLKIQRDELIESRKVLKEQAESQGLMTNAIVRLCEETRVATYIEANSSLLAAYDRSDAKNDSKLQMWFKSSSEYKPKILLENFTISEEFADLKTKYGVDRNLNENNVDTVDE